MARYRIHQAVLRVRTSSNFACVRSYFCHAYRYAIFLPNGQNGRAGRARATPRTKVFSVLLGIPPRATGRNRWQGTSVKVQVSGFVNSGWCNQKGDLIEGPELNRPPPSSFVQKTIYLTTLLPHYHQYHIKRHYSLPQTRNPTPSRSVGR